MSDTERRSLDLEDILKEFSEAPQEPEQTPESAQKPEDMEQTRRIDTEDLTRTRRLDPEEIHKARYSEAAWTQETRRMEPVRQESEEPSGDTIQFDALRNQLAGLIKGDEEQDVEKIWNPGDTVKTEPFTERWEPEYEQPIGKYVPPQPIQFQPRSRLHELKRKLVAGPEKRFYELSEIGVGKLQAAIFLSLLVVLISAVSTVMYAKGMVQENRLRLMIFSQFMALLVSGLLGSYQMLEGIGDLGKKRFTPNTLLAVTFVACLVDGVLCLRQLRVPCCAAFSLAVTMSLWGTYQRRSTEMSRMDTMRKAVRLDGLAACPDYLDGKKGFLRTEGQVEDFMDTYAEPSAPDKALNIYALAAMVVALAIGITACVLKYPELGMNASLSAGLQVGVVCLLAALPVTIFVSQSRPAWILERRLRRLGTVLCGWEGVKGLCGKAVFPVTGNDLYPAESLRMNGMKFFGSREPEQVISYVAAVVGESDCGFQHLFTGLLDSHNGRHYDATQLTHYQNGGMAGVVNGETVLLGSWSFMKEMEIEVPDSARISYGMYVAIQGELSGVFAVNYGKHQSAVAGLSTLTAYRSLQCTLVSDDFVVTPGFIKGKFGIKPKRVRLPEYEVRAQLRQMSLPEGAPTLLMSTTRGLAPLAYGVTGARVLRNTSWIGAILHIVGGTVGLAMMLTLVLLGGLHLITPVNMFLYQLIWMLPALLITEWTRLV